MITETDHSRPTATLVRASQNRFWRVDFPTGRSILYASATTALARCAQDGILVHVDTDRPDAQLGGVDPGIDRAALLAELRHRMAGAEACIRDVTTPGAVETRYAAYWRGVRDEAQRVIDLLTPTETRLPAGTSDPRD